MNITQFIKSKTGKMITIGVGVFILLVIAIVLIVNRRLTYSAIENRLIKAAKSYYSDNPKKLPQANNETATIKSNTLVKEGYIKELDKLSKNKNDNCLGQVTVYKNDDNLYYSANLSCAHYKTKSIKDVVTENIVTSGDGLYQIGEEYVFRGERVNNFIMFNEKLWRILKINSDGTIRIIETDKRETATWDDRYNSQTEYNSGINDYKVSRIKEAIDDIYNSLTDKATIYMTKMNLCVGKRKYEDTVNDGSIECSETFANQNLGLIQANEYALASISTECINPTQSECENYNYLADVYTWTITADKEGTNKVFKLSGSTRSTEASNSAQFRVVAHLNSQIKYVSGNGTENNPYKFK